MKADRLISILMLLQINKQMTANELATKLEVSTRTIYRDIESLSGLGIPIFSDRETNGGIKLLGNYKTSLTGINQNELYSLFIPAGDKILEDLGVEKLKNSTLLKLLGSSSSNQINEIEKIQNYIYIDMNTWNDNPNYIDKDILSTLQNTICNFNSVMFLYRKINEIKTVKLNPLGLVCKRGIWYLVGANHDIVKTYKVSSIENITLTDEYFKRPIDFDLESYWKSSTSNFKYLIPKYKFIFKTNPSILNHIKERKFITITNTVVKDNYIYIDINFDSILQGVEFAFGYGNDIEIIEPVSAINDIKKKSMEIIELYK